MSDGTPDDATANDVRALVEMLKEMLGLKEGELYTLRRVRVMEEAYNAAYGLARGLRKTMRGYRPDPALVISALVMHTARLPEAPDIVQQYLQALFSDQPASAASTDAELAETEV